jgi:hypothetical protein
MANPDFDFTEGFDKYGPTGEVNIATNIALGDWTTVSSIVLADGSGIVASLVGPGYALKLRRSSVSSATTVTKTLPGNYARVVGGFTFATPFTVAGQGITFIDTATAQFSLSINAAGQIEARRGGLTATVIATSTQTVTTNSVHCLEYDITFSAAAGIIKVWLDGTLTSLNLTSQNTKVSANAYANAMLIGTQDLGNAEMTFDHLYLWAYTAAGGTETPALTNPIVETQVGSSDSAVAFTPTAAVLGTAYRTTTTTSAPGANQLALRPYTPAVNMTINSVSIIPGATSAGAKYKGVIYSDSAGAPNTLLSSGTEVVGATSGTRLTLALVTPQALTAGTQYWIGYITDTSVVVQLSDTSTVGYKAANTYASGAPGTAPAMTSGQASYLIWGNATGMTTNWDQVDKNPPLGDLSYNQSSTVSQEDLFGFPALSSTPANIYTVAVKAYAARSDAGARTVDLRTKSVSTSSSGGSAGQTPLTTYSFLSSYFRTDPNTGVAWGASGLNAAKHGIKVAS